ncbi:hypothetical protein B0H15DRAFT_862203 [Mycena belliarum]|uniref:Uncharacterized protein n=1 Tax=Mycena belliarum TaxID=1033014 RepID=A0AAD6TRU7_9AGAR|nr:hypothetical protein B0H15DRAFT_862203 [Mycena belliae]
MTQGPPSSAAGPSRPAPAQGSSRYPSTISGPGLPPQLPPHPYYLPPSRHPSEPSPPPRAQDYPQPPNQWGNNWSPGYGRPQPVQSTFRHPPVQRYTPAPVQHVQPAQHVHQPPYVAQNAPQRTRFTEPYPHSKLVQAPPVVPSQTPAPLPRLPTPPSPPTPPAPKYRHWDKVIKDFLSRLGLKQAFNGFEADMLVMNADFERLHVSDALLDLLQGIMLIRQGADVPEQSHPLEERKLGYVHTPNPSSQTSIIKSISTFLAQNRDKNDASNRAEFVHSLAEKRKRLDDEACRANPDGVAMMDNSDATPSCARTDAKPVDRDLQMKYDIAKNSEGPLRRTTRQKAKAPEVPPTTAYAPTRPRTKSMAKKVGSPAVVKSEPNVKPNAPHSGLDERLTNLETHFSVRYVPAPPDSLPARLQFLEDHIIQLEKDYPPWAALHFNQPNRGWPPPPRATPIIVPPHLRSSLSSVNVAPPPKAGGVKTKNTGSSLQRAVMDQLAVKEARSDLAGPWQ